MSDNYPCEIRGQLDRICEIKGTLQLPCVIPTPGEFTENGTYIAPKGYAYNPVVVETFEPTGSVELTENGIYDVFEYAEAEVNVPQPSGTKQISITQNGTATEDVEWYEDAELKVNVPNTYTASDEGKVVASGALVGQTSRAVSDNGTYDTTLNDEVVVNVQPPLEQKTVTPTKQTQNIEPTAPNYGLSRVTVEPIPSEYIVPSGTKQINIVQNGVVTENIADYANAEITTNVPQMQRLILRPDAELLQSWTYDKRIVADEGIAIPAYSTSNQTLMASDQIAEITADVENYRYYTTTRSLAIPEYDTTDVGRGRFEWSSMVSNCEFVFTPMEELYPLVDGEYRIATNSAAAQSSVSYRGLYFTSSTGISIYASTGYGIWTPNIAPTYVGGNIRIHTPNFTMRGQPNILDQPFWEALTDIRFQYVIELWRVPNDSLQYKGWQAQQSADKVLDCLGRTDHKLT